MKKIALLFFVSLFVCAFMITANAGTYENLYYEIENGEVTITGHTVSEYELYEIVIPDKIEGYPVTKIDDFAFNHCTNLISVTLPNSITYIGEEAFYNTGLVHIVLPDNITYIGSYALGYYERWEEFYDPETGEPFGFCEQYSIKYDFSVIYSPNSVTFETAMGSCHYVEPSFRYRINEADGEATITEVCRYLESFKIPSEVEGYPVTAIGDYAFEYCSDLTSVTIPDSVTSIGRGAFGYCRSLTNITIPDSVTSIGDSAFSSCTSLTSITIPDSVTSIGDYALGYNYDSGYKVVDGFTIYGYAGSVAETYAKENGIAFEEIIDISMLTYEIVGGEVTITDCNTSATEVVIPDTIEGYPVTSIGNMAFYNCTSLTSVTIPDSVTSIGSSAFSYCTSLTTITIPDSVTSIGLGAFSDCTSLTSVTIPDSVTSIGYNAFYNCTSLTSVTIPDGITSIGIQAFYACMSLTSITIPDSVTSIGGYALGYYYDSGYKVVDGFTIYGYAGSVAETYAKENNIPYVYLDEFTVLFFDYDGSLLSTETVIYGCAATAPTSPTREADSEYTYTFSGWDKAFDNVTSDLTVTAVYEKVKRKTADADGDGEVGTKDIISLRRALFDKTLIETLIEILDLNGDGRVTVKDVTILRRYIAGGYGIELN